VWEKWLGDPLLAQPAAANGRVLMVWPKDGKHYLGSFDCRTGAAAWECEVGADVISAPVIVGDRVWLTTHDGCVTCVDVVTGKPLWTRPMQATSAPWVVADQVFVARRGRRPKAEHTAAPADAMTIAAPDSVTSDEEPWERISGIEPESGRESGMYSLKHASYLSAHHGSARKREFLAYDAAVGFGHAPPSAKLHFAKGLFGEETISRTWRFQGSRPVVADGVLYETAGDRLEATDVASGRRLWIWDDAQVVAGERRITPPAVANGRVLMGTWDGRLVSLDARSGGVRWQIPVGAPVHWHPTMSGGRVFAGLEDGAVVGFETGDPLDDGWPMWGGGPGHNGPLNGV
jgi:outer membrane protein assembly factor BamB